MSWYMQIPPGVIARDCTATPRRSASAEGGGLGYDPRDLAAGVPAVNRALLGFLVFCLVLVAATGVLVWHIGPTPTAIAFDGARRSEPYFLLQFIPQDANARRDAVPARRAGLVVVAGVDGGERIWSAGSTRRYESRARHGSYRGAMEAVDAFAFDRGRDVVQVLTGAEYRELAADPNLTTLLAGTATPPSAIDPAAVSVLVLFEVMGGNLRHPLGEPGESGYLAVLGEHGGRLAWDAPIDWIRGSQEWNRLLLLQFPDAAAAGAWLRDPVTVTERAIASRHLGDLLVLVALPEL
jgi:hypothetical protein